MRCPRCQHNNSRVIDSRQADDGRAIRRRRECENCSFRFTTFERIEAAPLLVIKKNGEREEEILLGCGTNQRHEGTIGRSPPPLRDLFSLILYGYFSPYLYIGLERRKERAGWAKKGVRRREKPRLLSLARPETQPAILRDGLGMASGWRVP